MENKYLNAVGSFECVVEKPEAGWIGEQGEKQTPFVRIPLVVTEGEESGKAIVYKAWLSEKAFPQTIRRLTEVFGFDGDLASLELGKQTLDGLPCNIQTESESYDGKERIKVKWLNPPGGGGGVKPLEKSKVNSIIGKLNAQSKAIAKSVKSSTPGVKPAATDAPAVEVGGDDIPF